MSSLPLPHPHVTGVLVGTFVALSVGTLVRVALLRGKPAELVGRRIGSLKSWWAMAVMLAVAIVLSHTGVIVLLAALSLVGFWEFARLEHTADAGRVEFVVAFGLTVSSYLWLWLGWWEVFTVWLPLCGLLLLATALVLAGRVQAFVHEGASTYFGLILVVYCPAHALAPYLFSETSTAPVGPAGLLLYLLLLTEGNDIAQAWVGRLWGRHQITPVVSPKKTWEGLLGGVVTTVLAAVFLALWLTPIGSGLTDGIGRGDVSRWITWSTGAGLLISLGGFLGDITMSAVKRDAGVKDSGDILPGQGGILDRIDSLTFTAPLFAYYCMGTLA